MEIIRIKKDSFMAKESFFIQAYMVKMSPFKRKSIYMPSTSAWLTVLMRVRVRISSSIR